MPSVWFKPSLIYGRPSQWAPPYQIPGPGQVVAISTNYASDVKPAAMSASQWNYSIFGFYGSGALVEEYSRLGAYVIAGSGGHAVPPNVGAAIFDFTDATWKRLDNNNGVPYQATDYLAAEIDTTYGEILEGSPGTPDQCPAPAHLYQNTWQLTSAQGGGPRGSLMRLRGQSAAVDSSRGSAYAHAFDLHSGLWSRKSTNANVHSSSDMRCVEYDPILGRFYIVQTDIGDGNNIDYLKESDWTWYNTSTGGPPQIGSNYSCFQDPLRRLFILHTTTSVLRAWNMDNMGAGPTTLTVSGSLPSVSQFKWYLYPPNGCFYFFSGDATSAILYKLQPPTFGGNPLVDTWTASTVTLTTPLAQHPQVWLDNNAMSNNAFFFVPSINCFCWIPGDESTSTTPVVILKPTS